MKICVIVCTFNRCAALAKALESLAASTFEKSVDWEVLVVDNNSSDQTREVVEEFRTQDAGRFRYLFEPQPGKSYALNSGIRNSNADILAFIDDDVIAEPRWLQNLTANLYDSKWSGAGGRILAHRTFVRPRWLSLDDHHSLAPLALFDAGPEPGELFRAPFGTNMAFQRAVFDKYGGFRTDLGPQPGNELRSCASLPHGGEDSEFAERLFAAGEHLRYEPSAVVYHSFSQKRLRKDYFLAWWFDKGRSEIRVLGPRPDTKYFVFGVPLYLFRNIAVGILRWIFALNPARRFRQRAGIWYKAGQIFESYRMRQVIPLKSAIQGNNSSRTS